MSYTTRDLVNQVSSRPHSKEGRRAFLLHLTRPSKQPSSTRVQGCSSQAGRLAFPPHGPVTGGISIATLAIARAMSSQYTTSLSQSASHDSHPRRMPINNQRPPRLDRMQISNLISEPSTSSEDTTPPSEPPAATNASPSRQDQHMFNSEIPNRAPQRTSRRGRNAVAAVPHSIQCCRTHSTTGTNKSNDDDDRPTPLLSHHACLRCRRARKHCTPLPRRLASASLHSFSGCARCYEAGHACEIRTETLPRWSAASRTTLETRVVRVADLDGRGTRSAVRLVPACRCPLRILE